MATNRDTPLEILLNDMHFWDSRADRLLDRARAMRALAEAAPAAQRKARLAAIAKLEKDSDKARMQAGKYAKAAAPYIHPKPERIDPDTL
jgi:hypothetical protein